MLHAYYVLLLLLSYCPLLPSNIFLHPFLWGKIILLCFSIFIYRCYYARKMKISIKSNNNNSNFSLLLRIQCNISKIEPGEFRNSNDWPNKKGSKRIRNKIAIPINRLTSIILSCKWKIRSPLFNNHYFLNGKWHNGNER